MKVKKLTLRNFRNIREEVFTPDAHLNFLLGSNGQGKTSFLEAIGYLSTLRSFRDSKTDDVIQYGQTFSEITCELVPEISTNHPGDNSDGDNLWKTELKVVFQKSDSLTKKQSKAAFINGKPVKKSTQYLSQRFGSFELGFHSIVFNPADHDLVRGDPAVRRAYLDRVLAAEDIEYLKALQKYNRILEQRNAVLRKNEAPQREMLLGFTEQLAQASAYLALKRLEWIEKLQECLNFFSSRIAPDQPELRLVYLSNWIPEIENLCLLNNNLATIYFTGQGHPPLLEQLIQFFWKKFSSIEMAEWKTGHSLMGAHRDDWTFFRGGQILRGHGSQGEVRTALLALKMAEIRLFQEKTGHRPLFLLDDFSSELDQNRRSFLLNFLSESSLQVFVTTTDDSQVAGKQYWVVNGSLRESKDDHRVSERQSREFGRSE